MKVATKKVDLAAETVTFAFANGKTLVCEASALSPDVYAVAALKGIGHRVGDSFSGSADHREPVEWAYQTACETWSILCGGAWEKAAESTGGILAEALAKKTGKSEDDCRTSIRALSDEKKKTLRKVLAVEIAEIELARARAKPATEINLEELVS